MLRTGRARRGQTGRRRRLHIQNVRQYFQHGRLGRVMCPICGLQEWQKVCRGQVAVELLENETVDRLSRNLAS